MEGKEWFEKSKYVYSLDEHDESGYLGIDENKVAEMLDEYYQYKLKSLCLHSVTQRSELLLFADYSESDKVSQTTDECVDNYLDQKQ